MINLIDAEIESLAINYVGNKLRGEKVITSENLVCLDEETKYLIGQYFLSNFNSEKFFYLSHTSDVALNAVYTYATDIFNLLYEKSTHPNIKGGEFYTASFKDCYLNGQVVNAVGLFKTEKKDAYLKVEHQTKNFSVYNELGININNLDKGCMIFNSDSEDGYWVSIVDKSGKGVEAQYWVDDFLGLSLRGNDFTQTKDFMTVYKNFVTEHLPAIQKTSKVEQASLLNKSMDFFKENEQFEKSNFVHSIFAENEMNLFDSYLEEINDDDSYHITESFPISDVAVKKQSRNFKRVIKLDNNFDIYIKGSKEKIKKGEDENGTFYKIYFNEEN